MSGLTERAGSVINGRLLKTSAKLLRKEFRQRELKILFFAALISVATVSLVSLLGDHLQRLIVQSSSQFLAADRQLNSPRSIPDDWIETAESMGIKTAKTLSFASMLFAGEQMQLVSVKAVSDHYPLKGSLETSTRPYAQSVATNEIPALGTVWLSPRLFPLLTIDVGAVVSVGDKDFVVSRVLTREPDVGFGFSALSPRVMINIGDLSATGIVQPGSRLRWSYLFSGGDGELKALELWLKPNLNQSHQWVGVKEGRPAIASSMDKAETYLLLGGSLAVLLACVAIAMSSRQFAEKQAGTVALLKTLGLKGSQLVAIFALQVVFLGLVAGVVGTLLGVGGFMVGISSLGSLFPELNGSLTWQNIELSSLFIGWLTVAIVMLTFALPPIIKLKSIAPMRVLRKEQSNDTTSRIYNGLIWGFGATGVFSLLYLYSGDWIMVLILLTAFLLISSLLLLFAIVVINIVAKGGRFVGTRADSFVRLGIASVLRRRWQSVFQVLFFSLALMLLAIIYLTRTSLLGDWQSQLPAGAPNHFFINIAEQQVDDVNRYFDSHNVETSGLYPMVRGRLTHINSTPVSSPVIKNKNVNALNRELNLTRSEDLPSDNTIEQGVWWHTPAEQKVNRVSLESTLAEKLDLALGDQLTFTIADQKIEVEIQSIRTVEWDSMRPNFYVIFPKGALANLSSSYITSVYLSPSQKVLLNEFSRNFPTITILEIDQLIDKIQTIIVQVSSVIELIMYLILAAAILVVVALINISMGERYREGALLRTLGAKSKLIVWSQFVEFGVIGLLSGFVAIVSAELVVWAIQSKLFNATFIWHFELWLWLPILSGVSIGGAGYYLVRRVTTVPPLSILRHNE